MNISKTKIETIKNPDGTPGSTWNPITGCLNGCEYCYARKLANGRLKSRYLANTNIVGGYVMARGVLKEGAIPPSQDPFYPRFWEDRLQDLFHRGETQKPRGIFVCDMSDLFGIGIPEEWTQKVMNVIELCPQHRFYLLTKQPQNLIKFQFPDNCWVGVSAWNVESLNNACHYLGMIEAKLRYISFEPLLDRIDLTWFNTGKIRWVIIGALTCGGADLAKLSFQYPRLTPMPYGNRYTLQPKLEWIQEIVEAADKAGVAVFLKNNIAGLFTHQDNRWAYDRDEDTPEMLKLRQELPGD